MIRYKFVQDDDCHWYLIPDFREVEFDEWMEGKPIEVEVAGDFEQMRIDGPHRFTFENPRIQE